jgi:lactate racemase
MWYWGENGRQHLGRVIVAGAENNHVPQQLGWERAGSVEEAIEMARGSAGRAASISLLHSPPIVMADLSA